MSFRDLFSQPFKLVSSVITDAARELSDTVKRMNKYDEEEGKAVGIILLRVGLYRLLGVILSSDNLETDVIPKIS